MEPMGNWMLMCFDGILGRHCFLPHSPGGVGHRTSTTRFGGGETVDFFLGVEGYSPKV